MPLKEFNELTNKKNGKGLAYAKEFGARHGQNSKGYDLKPPSSK